MSLDKLTLDLVEWVGIDPQAFTLGGLGYRSVAELFIHNTSLTKNDTFKHSGSVKDRFCSYFELLNPAEKAKIIQEILKIYTPDPLFPKRTPDLLKSLQTSRENLTKSIHQLEIERHLAALKMESLSTLEDLKKYYIKAIKKYHPDKVDDLGEEIKEIALLKTKEINASYEFLKTCLKE